jgi:hypothetical protein
MHIYQHLNGIGWDNVRIIKLEDYPCKDKPSLLSREQFWIDKLKPELNMNKAFTGLTKKEYDKNWFHVHEGYRSNYTRLCRQFYRDTDGMNAISISVF